MTGPSPLRRVYERRYRRRNGKAVLVKSDKWTAANRARLRRNSARWRSRNPGANAAACRRWRGKNSRDK